MIPTSSLSRSAWMCEVERGSSGEALAGRDEANGSGDTGSLGAGETSAAVAVSGLVGTVSLICDRRRCRWLGHSVLPVSREDRAVPGSTVADVVGGDDAAAGWREVEEGIVPFMWLSCVLSWSMAADAAAIDAVLATSRERGDWAAAVIAGTSRQLDGHTFSDACSFDTGSVEERVRVAEAYEDGKVMQCERVRRRSLSPE